MKTQTILISGGGVAGRALAFWLRRLGFTPTIVERAPGPRHGGYKVDIRGAGGRRRSAHGAPRRDQAREHGHADRPRS